jgi:hypothetical protein
VPGSHATGITYAPVEFSATTTTIANGSDLAPVPAIDDLADQYPVSSWTLRAGDAIALDSRTLHATGVGTPTAEFRRVSTRWAVPDTRYRAEVPGAASFWDVLPHGRSDRLHDLPPPLAHLNPSKFTRRKHARRSSDISLGNVDVIKYPHPGGPS